MKKSNEFSGTSNIDHSLHKRISRSASELSNFEERDKHVAGSTVVQKTYSFFSHLKSKLSVKLREKGRASHDTIHETFAPRSLQCSPRKSSKIRNYNQSIVHNIENNIVQESNNIIFEKMYVKNSENGLQNDMENDNQLRKEQTLKQYSGFTLKIHLKSASDLLAMDKNGTSDPYVKFKFNGKLMYKSKIIYRDLNPKWDEVFSMYIDDPFKPVSIKVFDYDWGFQDDFLGSAVLDLKNLELRKPVNLTLNLFDTNKLDIYMGVINFIATLTPSNKEEIDKVLNRSIKLQDIKKLKSQIWSSIVNIILIESRDIPIMNDDRQSPDTFLRLRLGSEKFKSKVSWRSVNPRWMEQLDFHLYDDGDQKLEITLWNKEKSRNEIIGRCLVDLKNIEREKTHVITKQFEEISSTINLSLTISGTTASETISDLTSYEDSSFDYNTIESRYVYHRTFHNIKDIGHLTVKVYKATGLVSADICGKSDPFCVLELGNARLQTQTEYKTLSPCWNKIFTFNVKDINNVLEVTVFDEDRDHRVEFLGKVVIPLLKIKNSEKRWYSLKDKKLRNIAKGLNPQILLEMFLIWNPIRAALRTLKPKEVKYMQSENKFKREIFTNNVLRVKNIVIWFIEISKIIQDCFEWESRIINFIALIFWLMICYVFQIWMLPFFFLLIFAKQYLILNIINYYPYTYKNSIDLPIYYDYDDDDDEEKEEKKTLKEKFQTVQDVTQIVQNSIGKIASFGESVKNLFNFTVPYLSMLAIILLCTSCIILFLVPIKYLLMLWAINKFFRRILRPHAVPNNEVLDLLSRVPDDEILIDFHEIHPINSTDNDKKREKKNKNV